MIPRIGLGTWQNTDPEQCAESVKTALELGYRHIDTAQFYKNEEYVGKGLNQSDVPRGEIILATKVWIDRLGHEDLKKSVDKSLERLDTAYIDLLYVHWPAGKYDPEGTFKAMGELVDEDKIKHIGVSNFTPVLLDEALKVSEYSIIANQVETHPLNQQDEMLKYLQEKDMTLVAYSPLARGNVMDIPELQEIAEKHDVSEAQVSLAWLWSHEKVAAIPKGTSKEHIQENLDAANLRLDNEDIKKIQSIDKEKRLIDPAFAPDW
ncbi:MAG: Glyoxal reductase [Candidatus Thorarchaeota archaeon]|nr:MAG: Glyoxal reductase [Candidatus Thorarchaeota archaeon]